jgi:hypothetical protein
LFRAYAAPLSVGWVMPTFILGIAFQQAIGVGSIVDIIVLIIILGFYKSYHWSANKKLFQRKTNYKITNYISHSLTI